MSDLIIKTVSGIDLVPSHLDLVGAEPLLYSNPDRFTLLAQGISTIKEHYDHILIDTPPFLGQFLLNGMYAADKIAIVFSPDGFALQGYDNIRLILKDIEEILRKKISLDMAILNRWSDPINNKGLFDRISLLFQKGQTRIDPSDELKKLIRAEVSHEISHIFEVPDSHMIGVSNKRGIPLALLEPDDPAGMAYDAIAEYIVREW